jgi:hypothetical protein
MLRSRSPHRWRGGDRDRRGVGSLGVRCVRGLWSGLLGMLTLVMHPVLAAMDGPDFLGCMRAFLRIARRAWFNHVCARDGHRPIVVPSRSTGCRWRPPGQRSRSSWWPWSRSSPRCRDALASAETASRSGGKPRPSKAPYPGVTPASSAARARAARWASTPSWPVFMVLIERWVAPASRHLPT